eukprot:NODE_23_length_42016_cov_0.755803.p26 type:complete len:148 gc:universal NODE_23_length_42016_cov_0.755803:9748-9305(-)
MLVCPVQIFTINIKNGNYAYSTQDFIDCVWEGTLQIEKSYFELVNQYTREIYGKSASILTPVKDSSRYFVVKLEQGGKQFFCGIGLADRSDAIELQQRMSGVSNNVVAPNKEKDIADLPDGNFQLKSTIVINKGASKSNDGKGWVSF